MKRAQTLIIIGILILVSACATTRNNWQEQVNQEGKTDQPIILSEDIWFTDLCFSPDGKVLAVANSTGTVELLDFPKLDMAKVLKGHADTVSSINFSPDGKLLASGSLDKTIKLWEVETGKELSTLAGHTEEVETVCFSPNGKLLASSSPANGEVRLWNVETGKQLRTFTGNATPGTLAFSNDSDFLAAGAILLQLGNRKVTVKIVGGFFGGGSQLERIKLWELGTGKELKTFKENIGSLISIIFTPDGELIASGAGRFVPPSLNSLTEDSNLSDIELWDLETNTKISTLIGGADTMVTTTKFSCDGRLLASGSYNNEIRVWDVKTGKRRELQVKETSIAPAVANVTTELNLGEVGSEFFITKSFSFSPDKKWLASLSVGGLLKIWEIEP